jgi:glycerol-3-phosphate dehydrogenase
MNEDYDVVVIGAGVVGAAIARELARYDLRLALVDAADDVGGAASRANTALWHTGYDAVPGSLEARLLRRSHELMRAFMPEAGVAYEPLGGLLVAWDRQQAAGLPGLLEIAHANGDTEVRPVTQDEIYGLEPHLSAGALGGLLVPGEGILCTFTLPLALATQAVINGARLFLNFRVVGIEAGPAGTHDVIAPVGRLRCRWVVNAAGLHADEINRLLGHHEFTVTPRRGELVIFDKLARRLIDHIILPVPTSMTKGVIISPTVYGNILVGPTAEDRIDKEDTTTSSAGLHQVLGKAGAMLPALLGEDITASYAGLRPATEHSDYQIRAYPQQRYVCAGGIRSTGISGGMGIAEHVVQLLADTGLALNAKAQFDPVRMPNIGEACPRPWQSPAMIAADPAYGEIVCHCERVSRGEIRDAMRTPIPARSLGGLRRRTRAMQGRCQGFNCHAAVLSLLANESGMSPASLMGLETVGAH